jgi:hypothetical protein
MLQVSSFSLSLSSSALSGKTIYEPWIHALLGTTSPFCETVILKSRTGAPLLREETTT